MLDKNIIIVFVSSRNEEIFIEFLEHLTRVRRFKFCISCLLPQEKEGKILLFFQFQEGKFNYFRLKIYRN